MQLNDLFAAELNSNSICHEREYKAIPGRMFAYDFYLPEYNLLIELQGGIFMKHGGHNTPSGIQRDADKLNLAVLHGFAVMHFTTDDVESGEALKFVLRYLEDK